MPKRIGENVPDRVSISFSPMNKRDMQTAIEKKEFTSIVNLVNTAIRFYFENRDKSPDIGPVKEWLVSEEGEQYLKDLIRKVKGKK